jgi:hypothetical protein
MKRSKKQRNKQTEESDEEDYHTLKVVPAKTKKAQIKQPQACKDGVLPKLHCSYLICGKSGSGKTAVLVHLLRSNALLANAFDYIFYCCDSPDDMVQSNLHLPKENIIQNFDADFLDRLIKKQEAKIKKKGADKADSILLVFDDILSKTKFLNSGIMTKLVCESRHYNISCIFNTQSYKKLPRVVRINVRGIILFPSNLGELEKFSEENALPGMSKKDFLKLVQHCTAEQYQFAFINHDAPPNDKLRKNFDTIVN